MAKDASDNIGSGEDRLIARFFRPLATDPGAFALTDDAAILAPPAGCDVVLKADAIIGGVHFLDDDPPELVAKKALRVNLSDLAAKGARPLGFLLSLALPKTIGEDWLAAFARGLKEDAEHYACPLYGGDTDRTPGPLMISIAAFGAIPHGTMVKRSGARPGDRVVVTGTIGDAVLGLALRRDPDAARRLGLDKAMSEHLIGRYRLPQPRNTVAEIMRRHASASMDVSDGLAGDLAKLSRVSGVDAVIDASKVPLSDAARTALAHDPALREGLLSGGDDYEIVASVPPDHVAPLIAEAAAAGVPVTGIGRIGAGAGSARFLDADGRPLRFARAAFSHFD
ncbi:MAG: thiamine-phosphate kinase [Xanthobacteraceae bacterium]